MIAYGSTDRYLPTTAKSSGFFAFEMRPYSSTSSIGNATALPSSTALNDSL